MQADFPNDGLFPKRGREISYTVNGKKKICRGELGEAARITLNGEEADLYTMIHANDVIVVEESTAGAAASLLLGKLPEFKSQLNLMVNGNKVTLPKYASVNGMLENEYYEIKNGDRIEMLEYYTVRQILDFMDVTLEPGMTVYVNNEPAGDDTQVYENFSMRMAIGDGSRKEETEEDSAEAETLETDSELSEEHPAAGQTETKPESQEEKKQEQKISIGVLVNSKPVVLQGKTSYVFVDIFDYIDFDTNTVKGQNLVTTIDGRKAEYMEPLYDGAVIEVYWE